MDNSEYKVCEVCGQEKHISEFSKSYPRRCKACVAEHTKMVRERAKQEQNRSKNTESRAGMQKNEIDWEQRRYEIAKECVAVFIRNPITIEDAAKVSVEQADALIAELKKGGQNV
jgi:hypothetical protein